MSSSSASVTLCRSRNAEQVVVSAGDTGHVDDQRLQISMVPKMLCLQVRLDPGAQQLGDVAHHYLAEIVIGIEAEAVLEYFGSVSIC